MTYIETTTLIKQTVFRTTVWKCYIHDIFSLWDMSKPDIEAFIEQATWITQPLNSWPKHLTLRCSVFRHGCIQRHKIQEKSILDAKTHFKQTETFLQTHFTSCHPPSVKKGFVKGEALRILRKNSTETTFEENNSKNA